MSDACCVIPNTEVSKADLCPSCSQKGKSVRAITINTLVVEGRKIAGLYPAGFYCQNPDCPTLYFFDSSSETLSKDDVNVSVGFKEGDSEQMVCYCFEHTKAAIQTDYQAHGESRIEAAIRAEVNNGTCSCEFKNPKGKCCLGDVRATYRELEVPSGVVA